MAAWCSRSKNPASGADAPGPATLAPQIWFRRSGRSRTRHHLGKDAALPGRLQHERNSHDHPCRRRGRASGRTGGPAGKRASIHACPPARQSGPPRPRRAQAAGGIWRYRSRRGDPPLPLGGTQHGGRRSADEPASLGRNPQPQDHGPTPPLRAQDGRVTHHPTARRPGSGPDPSTTSSCCARCKSAPTGASLGSRSRTSTWLEAPVSVSA
jgi:hypothetical protein